MAMKLDQYNRLEGACRDASNYPSNDIRCRLFRHILQSYKGQLAERSDSLFETAPKYPIDFLEAFDGEEFEPWSCTEVGELARHLWINRKDPRRRHV